MVKTPGFHYGQGGGGGGVGVGGGRQCLATELRPTPQTPHGAVNKKIHKIKIKKALPYSRSSRFSPMLSSMNFIVFILPLVL